jgi:hypothetical protein
MKNNFKAEPNHTRNPFHYVMTHQSVTYDFFIEKKILNLRNIFSRLFSCFLPPPFRQSHQNLTRAWPRFLNTRGTRGS